MKLLLLLLLISFQSLSYIRVLPSYSLVPICCYKNETEENCKLRIEQSGALFDVGSELVAGYQCLVGTKYECYDIEIREHGRSGDFTFKDVTYNKDEYCFNNQGQFCLFHCIVPICCNNGLEDKECINKLISENGTIIIPNNSLTTYEVSNCSEHKIEICVHNEQVSFRDNGVMLKNDNTETLNASNDYCIKILNSEGNCEDICWDYSLVPICCHKDEIKENCKLRIENSVAHFDIYSVLFPGYSCLVDTKYECHDIEIVKYERSGKFSFQDVTYNKDQYCVNSKGEFCIIRCTISVCCAIGYEDFACIKKYVSENGTIVIPITDKATKCPGHTMEILISDEQVTVQNDDIILKNCTHLCWQYPDKNCTHLCWQYPDIRYSLCCWYEGKRLLPANAYSNEESLKSSDQSYVINEYVVEFGLTLIAIGLAGIIFYLFITGFVVPTRATFLGRLALKWR